MSSHCSDYRSNALSHEPQAPAPSSGQLTFTSVAPRRSSITISCAVATQGRCSSTGTNAALAWSATIILTGRVASQKNVTDDRSSRLATSQPPTAVLTAMVGDIAVEGAGVAAAGITPNTNCIARSRRHAWTRLCSVRSCAVPR